MPDSWGERSLAYRRATSDRHSPADDHRCARRRSDAENSHPSGVCCAFDVAAGKSDLDHVGVCTFERVSDCHRRTPVRAILVSLKNIWRVPMSLKSKLSAAAFVAFVAMSATAIPASAQPNKMCEGAVSYQSCGSHLHYVEA